MKARMTIYSGFLLILIFFNSHSIFSNQSNSERDIVEATYKSEINHMALYSAGMAAVITTQPASGAVTANDQIYLFVVATGTDLSYQWYKDAVAITGETHSSLSIPNCNTDDAGDYYVEITDNVPATVTSSTATITVNKINLTVTGQDYTYSYGDAIGAVEVIDIVYPAGTNASMFDVLPSASTLATNTSAVGPYAVTVAAGSSKVFNVTAVDGTLTINKAPLTATANNKSMVYGDAIPTYDITYNGFKNGNSSVDIDTEPTLTSTAAPTSNVGDYSITFATAGTDNNYNIIPVDGTVSITAAVLTATADDKSRVYGDEKPTFTITYSGFKNSETVADLTTEPVAYTAALLSSGVGTESIDVTGGVATNYSFNLVSGTLTITAAPLTVTGVDASREYGVANPTLSVSYSGFKNSDSETDFTVGNTPTVSSPATITSDVGTYNIVPAGGVLANYSISHVNGTLTISKAPLTATANDKSMVYGDAVPTYDLAYSGFRNGNSSADVDTEPTLTSTAAATSNVGDYAITFATAGTDNNYAITTVDGTVSVTAAVLTATADDKSRVYGDENPALTMTYSGFKNSETVADLITEPVAYTAAMLSSGVGTESIDVTGGVATNYSFNHVSGTLTITAAPLTVTGVDASREYGVANPTLSVSYSGFKNGETEAGFPAVNHPTASTTATITSDVGTYNIVPAGGSFTNYSFAYTNGTLTVSKAPLTATANDKSMVYGDAVPTYDLAYSGFRNGNSSTDIDTEPTLTSTAASTSNVGDYAITFATGGTDNNYAITTVDGTVSVTAAVLTATADDKSRVYGDENPALTITYSGFKNSETVADLTTEPVAYTAALLTSGVGTESIDVTGGVATNYSFNHVSGTLTITAAPLTVTGVDASREYGVANPTLSVSYSGFKNGETEAGFPAVNHPTASTTATITSDVGTYNIVPAGGSFTNYSFVYTNGTLTISKAPLTATANNKSMVYGDAVPTYDMTYSGFRNGNSSADVDTEPTLTSTAASTSNVGDYAITFATGGTDNNYNITTVDGTVSVTAAVLTATADDKSRVYGDENPALTITYSGFKNSETLADLTTEPVAYTAALLTSGVGTESIDVTGGVATNYSFNHVSGTLTITTAPLTVTGVDASREYGVANPTLSVSYSGFKNGETEAGFPAVNHPTASTTATITSDVGTYNIVPSGGSFTNYSFAYTNGTLTVSKAPLTATANDKSMVYGDAVPTYDMTYSGFRNGNSSADVDTEPTLTSTAASTSNVGDYAITFATAGTDNNYAITTVDGTVSVTAAVLTATADDKSRVYGDENPALTITYSGFKNSETVADLTTEPVAYTAALLTSGVGTESIDVTGGVATNYSFNHVSGTLTITAAPLTVTGVDASREYGVANPTLSVSYSGFKNGETEAGFPAVNHPTASTTATITSDVGTYNIVPAGGSFTNYSFAYTNGTLTVSKAPLTVTANNKNMVYGDAVPTYDMTYSGFRNGNSSADVDTEPTLTSTAASTSNVGDYAITFATAGTDNNYAITTVDGTVSVTAAVLTATADDKSRAYGDENPALTISYSGFKNSETVADLTTEPVAYTAALLISGVGTESIDVTGGVSTNYSFNHVSGTLTITAAPLTVTGVDASREFGVANPTLSVSYSGFKNGETEAGFPVVNHPTASTTATITSDVGTYNIVPSGGSFTNYSFAYTNGTLTVSKAPLTATANDKSMVYGDAVPTYDMTYSGFRNGNSSADVDTEPTLTSTAASTSNVGDYAITFATGGTDNNYTITTVDGTVSVTAAILTATADDKSKVYGDENPVLTITYSGFKNSETVADLTTVPVAYTSAMLSSGVGTESIDLTGGVATNYSFNHVSGTLTITASALTITGVDASREYGVANPTLSLQYSGFKNSDSETDFTIGNEPTVSTVATITSDVGTYNIVPAGGVLANYTISHANGTLTVSKAPLTATANNKSMVYGDAVPTYDMTYSGFRNGNSSADVDTEPTLTSTAASTSNVGDYAITFATAGTDNNYAIITVDGTVSVTAAVLTATADDKSRVYGDENPALTITYSGFKNSETVADLTTVPVAYTSAMLSSGVGTESIDLTGGVATNYSFNHVSGTLTITAAPLTVTGVDASREYGVANPTLSVNYSGFKNSDSETDFTIGNEPTVSTVATITSDVGTYNIVPAGGALSDYTLSYANGTLTVSKAPLTATANNKSMVYGDAVPTYDMTYSGFRNGNSSADVDTEPTLTSVAASTSNVGDYAITFATGGTDNNYAITTVDGTVSITEAVLTATADDKSRVYGDENPALTITYSGFKNSETVADLTTVPVAYTSAMLSSGVGTESIDLTGGVATNYSFNHVSGTLTITAAPLTVTGVDASREFGVANPTLSVSYSGFKNSDSETDFTIGNEPTVSTVATITSDVGTYNIVPAGGALSDYTLSYANGTLTVSKAPLTATANNKSMVYGDAVPTYDMTYSGFRNGNSSADVDTEPTLTSVAASTSNVGDYAITFATGGADNNYNITIVEGTVSVTAAVLTAIADDKSKVYGDENPTLTIAYSGFKNSETVADLTTEPVAYTSAMLSSGVGTESIDVTGGVATNYSFNHVSGTLTITAAPLTVTGVDASREYGVANPTLSVSYSGFKNGETEAGFPAVNQPTISTVATITSDVGTYNIIPAGGSFTNYSFVYSNGTFTISKANLTAKVNDSNITYGDNVPAFAIVYSGFRNSEDATVLDASPTLNYTVDNSSGIGIYDVEVVGGSDNNYNIIRENGKFTIVRKKLYITADDKSMNYGERVPVLTYKVTGFSRNESLSTLRSLPDISTEGSSVSDVGVYDIIVKDASADNYELIYQKGTLNIVKSPQTIMFKHFEQQYISTESIEIRAHSTSGLDLYFTSSDESVASIQNNSLVFHKPGEAIVTASQDGDNNYLPAQPTSRTIVILSDVTSSDETAPSANLTIEMWPNPAKDFVNFIFPDGTDKLYIYDSSGRLVYSDIVTYREKTVDVSSLLSGLYIVKVDVNNTSVSIRLIIE